MPAVPTMNTEIPAAIKAGIRESLGCVAIGGILGTAIYGITVLQTYIYFRRYKKDPLGLKLLVGLLFLLDTGTSALVSYGTYEYMVSYFDQPWDKYLTIPPTLGAENGLTVVIATLCQCYFAQKLWYFSNNKPLSVSIVVLSLCALGPGIGITVHLFSNKNIFSIGDLEVRILAGFANGLSVICDVTIAAGLCYYFQAGKSGFSTTNSLIDRLMLYAIQRGTLTAISQFMHMVTTVAMPGRFIFLPFAFLQGKLYCNTLLATLNVRDSLKQTGRSDNGFVEPGSLILASLPRDGRRNDHGRNAFGDVSTGSTATIEISAAKAQDSTFMSESGDFDSKV